MRFAIAVFCLILAIPTIGVCQNKVVRDRNGTIVEQWSSNSRGSVTVRDRNGTIIEQRQRQGDSVVVRDRNGRIIQTERDGR